MSTARSTRKAFQSKDASHLGFYAQFGRGLSAGLAGLLTVCKSAHLRDLLKGFTRPWLYSNAALLVVALVAWSSSSSPDDHDDQDPWEADALYLTLMRYSRIVSAILLIVLDKNSAARTDIFSTALQLTSPEIADRISHLPKSKYKQPFPKKVARIGRLLLIRFLSLSFVRKITPSPILHGLKFASLRSTLGDPVSALVVGMSLIPSKYLAGSVADELILGAAEAIMDSFALSKDAMRSYLKKVGHDVETREYLLSRYRGYLTGMGFFYSMLMEVPFLGVPAILVAHAAAGVQLTRILERNATKSDENYRPLPGEPTAKTK